MLTAPLKKILFPSIKDIIKMVNLTFFRKGYKYVLHEDRAALTDVKGFEINHPFFFLFNDGLLVVKNGYAWDGPSGPVPDLDSLLTASLVHDVLYQALREGLLPQDKKDMCDKEFEKQAIIHGANKVLARVCYIGLRAFGRKAATEQTKIYEAP